MIFTETPLTGAYRIDPEPRRDPRGFFARTWCAQEFAAHGLSPAFVQANLSYSAAKGTLRGIHYQVPPHAENKLLRCTRGTIYDVIVDLRPASPTYRQWLGVELSARNHRMLFVPEGFGHGFLTLTAHAEVTYQVSEFYHPEAERGLRYDDPALGIRWPAAVTVVSDKDRSWPDFTVGPAAAPAGAAR
jgi:dTDP-4-dehydrorhamnose 3,5-epimerase